MMKCLELEYARCESSEWKSGALRIQPDALGEGGSNEGANSMQPLGLYARPEDPTEAGAAGALVGRHGDDTFIAPQTDPRNIGTVPQGPKGSVTLYAPRNDLTSYIHLDGGDEAGKAYTQILLKYGAGAGKSLVISLDTKTDGQENIQIRHGEGHGVLFSGDKKIVLNSANGAVYVEINDTKIVANGDVQINGGMMLGGPAGQPVATTADLDALKAAIQATLAGLVSTAPASPVSVTVPFVAVTPGSPKVSASVT